MDTSEKVGVAESRQVSVTELPKQIVVLGAGDWAKRYAEVLKPYVESKKCNVIFCYDSQAGREVLSPRVYHQYLQIILSNVVQFESWGDGCQCLDVANQKARDRLRQMEVDAVFIVTPDETHCYWAGEFLLNTQLITVEKPFDASTGNIDLLVQKLSKMNDPPDVWGFDHYLVRAHQFMQSITYFIDFLGGDVEEFRFHMLESTDRGMKERAPSIQKGLIFDMASHAPALVLPFGKVETIRATEVRAALYQGADQYMKAQPGLKGGRETFAAIDIVFNSAFSNKPVNGKVWVGKNVGSQEEKFVEVTGVNGRKIRLDLITYIVDFIENNGEAQPEAHLFANPIHLLVRETLAGRSMASLFPPKEGRMIVEIVEKWCEPVTERLKRSELDTYDPKTPPQEIINKLRPLP